MMIFVTEPAVARHDAGSGHPERPARYQAVVDAANDPRIADGIAWVTPREATRAELSLVHTGSMLDRLDSLSGTFARIDADTAVCPESIAVAKIAAGAGLTAVETLRAGEADSAFCCVRPPGHHATKTTPMGFCLLNNVAVTAAHLVAAGERVVIADFDAHHGNGTQDVFYDNPSVLFISWHQSPLYPGSGAIADTGTPAAAGTTVNLPFSPGTTGDSYQASIDEVLAPVLDRFAPTWLLISAGYDAHRDDPLTQMGLSAGDFGDLTAVLMSMVPPGRTIAFLEGGYDLNALTASSLSTMAAMLGERIHPETPTSGGLEPRRRQAMFDAVAGAQGLR